jgi:RHS repeat-associated protein
LEFFSQPEGYATYNNGNFSYIYQYKDHLGNNRLSYSDSNNDDQVTASEIVEKDNYYPFGMKHKEYNSIINGVAHKYKYNGKELQDEMGLNVYDYGARLYDPAAVRLWQIDPKAEQMRRWSPYSYAFDNPMRFIDPDGMAPQDVIIGGTNRTAAFIELQKSVNGQLNLTMDRDGRVSYTNIAGVNPNADATQLTNAINDHSITVNVNSTDNNNLVPFGDAFQGNTVTNSPTGNTVSANQLLNPTITERADSYYERPGANTLHAVTEGYQGARISQASGISAPPAIMSNANPVYDAAHAAATPQSGPINAGFVNASGDVIPTSEGAIHLSIFTQRGNDAMEINRIPIPR